MSTSDEFPPPTSPLDAPPVTSGTTVGTVDPAATMPPVGTERVPTASTSGGDGQSKTAEAKDAAREVASGAKEEAKSVARQAKDQVSNLKDQASGELRRQADERGQQAAGQLRSFSDQIGALAEGRRDEAGKLGEYLDQGRQRIDSLASRLEQEGPQGLLDDVASFGRRRPGLFLLGAAVAGVAVGRLVRAGASSDDESSDASTYGSTYTDPSGTYAGTYTGGDVATGSLESDVYATDAGVTYTDPAEGPR